MQDKLNYLLNKPIDYSRSFYTTLIEGPKGSLKKVSQTEEDDEEGGSNTPKRKELCTIEHDSDDGELH